MSNLEGQPLPPRQHDHIPDTRNRGRVYAPSKDVVLPGERDRIDPNRFPLAAKKAEEDAQRERLARRDSRIAWFTNRYKRPPSPAELADLERGSQ
jgi:hypothetical protein